MDYELSVAMELYKVQEQVLVMILYGDSVIQALNIIKNNCN